jgi:predicted XRE-type DNA-binding protein
MDGMNQGIRERILKELKTREISQYKMAQDLDIPQPSVSRLLKGRSGKIPESWQAILDYLDLELTVTPKKK